MSCKTTALLAAYIDDCGDVEGVLELIRTKYPRSISTYMTQIRKELMSLNKPSPAYAGEFRDLRAEVRAWKAKARGPEADTYEKALRRLEEFDDMILQDKYDVQRNLKNHQFTGSAVVDDLLSRLTILPKHVSDLRVEPAEKAALQKKASDALMRKSSDAMHVDAAKLLERVGRTLRDLRANPFDLACALSCVTGRRMIEIFNSASLAPVEGCERACVFEGQAKKRVSTSYRIPLLADFRVVSDALARLRVSKNTQEMSNSEVNLKYSSSCNAAARRLFGESRTFHACRAVYGVTSFHAFMPHKLSLNLWLSKVLGHSCLSNSLNYSSIHVTDVPAMGDAGFSFD